LNCMIVGELALGLVAIYVGPMQTWFDTAWLPVAAIAWPFSAFAFICIVEEFRKLFCRVCLEDPQADAVAGTQVSNGDTSGGKGTKEPRFQPMPLASVQLGPCHCFCLWDTPHRYMPAPM